MYILFIENGRAANIEIVQNIIFFLCIMLFVGADIKI